MKEHERHLEIRKEINKVSPSFCAAKWNQVTIHLQNGRTHSCHHPSTHAVPLDELAADPSALHNTQYKMTQRKLMLEGERPKECQYCWNVEDLGDEFISDRVTKSGSSWAHKDIKKISEMPWDQKINPRYVELSFSNVCNFKCSYCSPTHSSKWVEESVKHGGYPTSTNFNNIEWLKQSKQLPIHHKEHNPYVEAFWKWWPDLIKDLEVLRVTGGEPLLDDNTYQLMDMVAEESYNLEEIAFNSNACIPEKLLAKFIEKMKILEDKDIVTRVYTSVDTHGAQAEYIRNGLDYELWLKNTDRLLTELPKTKVTVMCTANILSITSFEKMLADIYALKIKHYNEDRKVPITIDISILRWPRHQCLSILPGAYADFLLPALQYMRSNQEGLYNNEPYKGFFDFEIDKLERLIEFTRKDPNANESIDVDIARNDFYNFVNEHDRRRNTNFLETFPELKDFYLLCESIGKKTIGSKLV